MIQLLILAYLRRRYGGDVYALKHPLGFMRGSNPSRWRRIKYAVARNLWKAESALFEKYGQPMRDNWDKAFSPQ